ncbi:hypothetical protein HAZT_HAZT000918 [Hyalella azteca]|uniref:CUB domain-containing protein n=1 Tax=Hyalella azteca TaxID=294128 RepID=A0A6A0GZ23_HYAAZ|nr:hypothetical protein HAZT_HAZT000918 [Hyalella azteca]
MSNALTLLFLTDATTSSRGFRALATQHDAGCGGVLHGHGGNITSPGFPSEDYPVNVECVWTITAAAGYHVKLEFVDQFDVETTSGCTNDYVQVVHGQLVTSDGGTGSDDLQWLPQPRLCGKQIPSPVASLSEKLRLTFSSNQAVQGKGFKAMWKAECGGVFNSSSGIIRSPNHPGMYPARANCSYVINAHPNAYVSIQFEFFELEGSYGPREYNRCPYDWVQLTSSGGAASDKHCGNQAPSSLEAQGPAVLRFVTDTSIVRRGFLANFTVRECGGEITAPSVITLPSTSGYFHDMNCRWNITAPADRKIRFNLLDRRQDLEDGLEDDLGGDLGGELEDDLGVNIYDGSEVTQERLIGTFCGDLNWDLPIRSSTANTATVTFESDSSVAREGFTLDVSFTHVCGGTVNIASTQDSQIIRSLDANNDGGGPNLVRGYEQVGDQRQASGPGMRAGGGPNTGFWSGDASKWGTKYRLLVLGYEQLFAFNGLVLLCVISNLFSLEQDYAANTFTGSQPARLSYISYVQINGLIYTYIVSDNK